MIRADVHRVVGLLHQRAVWESYGDTGAPVRTDVASMCPSHRASALDWLRVNADRLHQQEAVLLRRAWQVGEIDDERYAAVALLHDLTAPSAWIESTPLVQRLVALERRDRQGPRLSWWRRADAAVRRWVS